MSTYNNSDVTIWSDGYVQANGIRQHYWRTGDGTKPALVLCHGVTDNGLCWTPVARALEDDFDVIMVDARGHGLSDSSSELTTSAPETGYTTEERAADLVALIQTLGLEKPVVLGHSMGGATASYAAMQHPGLFSKVVLEDPGWWDDTSRHQTMSDEARKILVQERRADIIARAQLTCAALIADQQKSNLGWSNEELGPWALAKQQVSPHVANVFGQARPAWRGVARGIQCPTLLITAEVEKGAIVTPAMAQEAVALNPNIQIAHIPGVGHNIRREAFRAYMAAVKAFLAKER